MFETAIPLAINPTLPVLVIKEIQLVLRKRDLKPWMHIQKLNQYCTFMYIIEGSCDICLNDTERYRLTKGQGVFIDRSTIYASTQYELPFEYVWIGFDYDVNSTNNFSFNRVYNFHNPRKIEEAVKKMSEIWLSNSYDSVFKVMQYMYEILGYLAIESINENTSYNYKRIKEACDFMESNYTKRYIDVKELADISALSVSQFNRIFRQVYNSSPIKYMNSQRMEIAKKLLTGSNEQVGIIAEMCGFSSEHYFSRMFKKLTGLSPLQFRNQMG